MILWSYGKYVVALLHDPVVLYGKYAVGFLHDPVVLRKCMMAWLDFMIQWSYGKYTTGQK